MNDRPGLTIPYEYLGVEHACTPNYLACLSNGLALLLEIKGEEDNRAEAKHDATRRWISAVKNWAQLGQWDLHVCRNPQLLEKELDGFCRARGSLNLHECSPSAEEEN